MATTHNVRRRFDPRVHAAFTGGWQTLTLCGKRVNWLDGQGPEPAWTDEPIDCPECGAYLTGEEPDGDG
jgi:hypothetical protein